MHPPHPTKMLTSFQLLLQSANKLLMLVHATENWKSVIFFAVKGFIKCVGFEEDILVALCVVDIISFHFPFFFWGYLDWSTYPLGLSRQEVMLAIITKIKGSFKGVFARDVLHIGRIITGVQEVIENSKFVLACSFWDKLWCLCPCKLPTISSAPWRNLVMHHHSF